VVPEGKRRDRGPRPLAEAVERVRAELAPPTLLARVQARWAVAVGVQVAEQAEPVSERGGVVTVACRSATWSAELSLLAPGLLERLNEALGEGLDVRDLRFTTRPT
jgi:predicted nucleic acid-binding Zn ribbon protein